MAVGYSPGKLQYLRGVQIQHSPRRMQAAGIHHQHREGVVQRYREREAIEMSSLFRHFLSF